MLIEDGKYINNYFGVMRDILIKDNNKVEIVFNAYLNDDLNFKYVKNYPSEKEAKRVVNEFIIKTKYLREELPHSVESISRVNKSIHKLICDILIDNVDLPENGQGYEFIGDKDYLKKRKEKNTKFVYYD